MESDLIAKKLKAPLTLSLAASLALAGCGGGGSSAPSASPPIAAPAPAPTLTLGFDKASAALGQSATLAWSSANATNCQAAGAWSGALALNGSSAQTPAAEGRASYEITCSGLGGSVTQKAVLQTPFAVKPTSYQNMKERGVSGIAFPASAAGAAGDGPLAWAVADFTQTGALWLFTANQNYGSWNLTKAQAESDPKYLSDFELWSQAADGSYVKAWSAKGCLHPRKAVVADFNRDGIPDVFVACHGYDGPPFAGESSKLALSDGKGGFSVTDATGAGFFHGATAADLNADGYPDLIVADNTRAASVYALINQKDGTFREDPSRVPGLSDLSGSSPYFSVEALDADGDGKLDLIAGGHEQSGSAPTRILFGDGAGVFGAAGAFATLPSMPGRGVVLDFTLSVSAGSRGLYVNRSSDETSPEGFYGARTLQWVDLASLSSLTLLDQKGAWIPWWLPAVKDGRSGVAPYYSRAALFYAR